MTKRCVSQSRQFRKHSSARGSSSPRQEMRAAPNTKWTLAMQISDCFRHDVTVVAAHRIDHQFQRGIDNRAGSLRIEILLEFGRPLDVREERGHGLALALQTLRVRLGACSDR